MTDQLNAAIKASIGADTLELPFGGHALLDAPLINKGSAFTDAERGALGLHGLLPADVLTMDAQLWRVKQSLADKSTDLEKHIYLRSLQDRNETLFYRFVVDSLKEVMPLIYTPTVGLACQQFSKIYRKPRGLYVSFPHRSRISEILAAAPTPDPRIIVVTDGQRILGLGDQGAGGMGIPIGKLSLYIGCGGINPAQTLPIILDVGTDNQGLLEDPDYIGWRHPRVGDDDYYAFVEEFVTAVETAFPGVLLQFEDFALPHALPLLERYRERFLCFNDDIQGTAAVAVSTVLSATRQLGENIANQRVVMVGAGSAGCGIAELIIRGMSAHGISDAEARERIFMVDRNGLVIDIQPNLTPAQTKLAQPRARLTDWSDGKDGYFDLLATVKNAAPTVLIGVAGVPGLFTEAVIRAQAERAARPVVLPLSNPTSRAEGTPADILAWTEGRALVATGSPFDPVELPGLSKRIISQCNNSYIFPGIGLGVVHSGATRVSDAMMLASADALAESAGLMSEGAGALLPPLDRVREVSVKIAVAVARQAAQEGLAAPFEGDLDAAMRAAMWEPRYRPVTIAAGVLHESA